jgi:hypothetical protein
VSAAAALLQAGFLTRDWAYRPLLSRIEAWVTSYLDAQHAKQEQLRDSDVAAGAGAEATDDGDGEGLVPHAGSAVLGRPASSEVRVAAVKWSSFGVLCLLL